MRGNHMKNIKLHCIFQPTPAIIYTQRRGQSIRRDDVVRIASPSFTLGNHLLSLSRLVYPSRRITLRRQHRVAFIRNDLELRRRRARSRLGFIFPLLEDLRHP